LESPESERQYNIIGGKTILGKIFTYQEKTGMPYKEILKLPYIAFVIGMLDAPQIDYKSKKVKKTDSASDQIAAFHGAFGS